MKQTPLNMKIVQRCMPVLMITALACAETFSQSPATSGADTSANKTGQSISGADTSANKSSQSISDTGFLQQNIRQQILDIKLAQLANDKATSPRVKQIARVIVTDGRENLRRMLALTKGQKLQGLTQAEIDSAMGQATTSNTMNASDPRAAATTGNTVTDSLGSGSSGSGNVKGEDTGTLARTFPNKDNPSYSEQGDYAYNNNLFMHEAEILNTAKGKGFEAQWVQLMMRRHQGKTDYYNKAMAQVKDTRLKTAISQALPRIRSHNSDLIRLSKDRDISEGMENRRQGDANSGAGTNEGGNR
jgi:uncharacterized protein (DUF305 family)